MPKINEMSSKFKVLNYAASLDLNMEYYHILLSKKANNLCTIILPWGKYLYKHLLMGVSNSPDIFQHKTNDLF